MFLSVGDFLHLVGEGSPSSQGQDAFNKNSKKYIISTTLNIDLNTDLS